jgi:hypothetical protein
MHRLQGVRVATGLLVVSFLAAVLLYAPLVYGPYGGGPNIGGGFLVMFIGLPAFVAGLVLLVDAKVEKRVIATIAVLGVGGFYAMGAIFRWLGGWLAA